MQKLILLEDVLVGYELLTEGTSLYLTEQPVIAPPKPQTEPQTEPDRTEEPEKDDPFRPPQPHVDPNPKAFRNLLEEGYDDEVTPSIASFWKDIRTKGYKHAFSKHPILALHGDNLSRKGYEHHKDVDFNPSDMMQLMMQVQRIEAPHKKELEDLAKQIVVKIWGIPKEMLQAKLTNNTDIKDNGSNGSDGSDKEDEEISSELLKQINKRITLNTFTQGAAVHQMMSMHHLIDKKLSEINPDLVSVYTKLSKLMHKAYWYIDYNAMMNLAGAAAGSEKVSWDDGNPSVVAKAWIFPILTQELSKGVMELLTLHGYSNLDVITQEALQKHADKLKHEPYLIMIGPTLWRKFLKVIPKDIKIADLIAAFSKLDPDDIHDIVDDIIDNPDQASQKLNDLV